MVFIFYISLLSNWILKEFPNECTLNGSAGNSRYIKYGNNQVIRISDHIYIAKGSTPEKYNINIIFSNNNDGIIVSIEYDTYVYKTIAEVKELIKSAIRFNNTWKEEMVFALKKKHNQEVLKLEAEIKDMRAKNHERFLEIHRLIKENKALNNEIHNTGLSPKNLKRLKKYEKKVEAYKLMVATMQNKCKRYKEKIDALKCKGTVSVNLGTDEVKEEQQLITMKITE